MNDNSPTIVELLTHPKVQKLVSQEDLERIAENLSKSKQTSKDPMYIRILSGVGAWFAAVFLILFLAISDILDSGMVAIICGMIFLVAAIIISRTSKAEFLSQLSLALVFAGNILVLLGVIDEYNRSQISVILITHALVCAVVYPLYANSIYRFLAPTALVVLATAWIIEEEALVLIHVLVGAETLLAGILLLGKKRAALLTPLVYSAAAMLPATLLFINLTQVNIWGWRTDFNEPLWPSNILLTGGLIYLYLHLAGGPKRLRKPWLILAVLSTILLGIFTTPGILVAVGLLIAGYAFGDRILTALAYLFLPSFLVFFYYALNVDLAHKSLVIAGSGVLLLVVRWIAGHCQPKEVTT
jgi:uncharacterized membrane protein